MKDIKELTIEGERLYIKKSKIFGWSFVHPIKINDKLNWKNILIGGSWIRFMIMAITILLIAGAALEYSTAIKTAQECLKLNPLIILP